jgi:hypothetical protein
MMGIDDKNDEGQTYHRNGNRGVHLDDFSGYTVDERRH